VAQTVLIPDASYSGPSPNLVSLAAREHDFFEAQFAHRLDVLLVWHVQLPVAGPADLRDADNLSSVAASPKQRPVFASKGSAGLKVVCPSLSLDKPTSGDFRWQVCVAGSRPWSLLLYPPLRISRSEHVQRLPRPVERIGQ
jgi:hypothetical protein